MAEAVSLYSGSLASSVSTELAVNYGDLDRVVILTLRSPFFVGFDRIKRIAERLWPDSRFRSKSIKKETDRIGAFDGNIENGSGSYCDRCQEILLETGRDFVSQVGADFLISGEVTAERSEQVLEIDREIGLEGLVFRPLSSKGLPDSVPEIKNLVPGGKELTPDRRKEIQGNLEGRLEGEGLEFLPAEERCKLTRCRYRKRLKDLLREDSFNVNDLNLLDFEDYYKIPPDTKVVLGRGSEGKRKLHNYFLPKDLRFYLPTREGPMALVRSDWKSRPENQLDKIVKLAARITAGRGTASEKDKVDVNYRFEHDNETYSIQVTPLEGDRLKNFRL